KSLHEVTFDTGAFVNDASLMGAGDAFTTTYHPANTSLAIPADKWAPVSLRVRRQTEGHSPIVSVEGAGSAVVGSYVKVKNLSNFPINRAVVMTRSGITGLFDIGPGEERQCAIQPVAPQTFSGWYFSQLPQGSPEADVLSYVSSSFPFGGGSMLGGDVFSSTQLPDLIAQLDRPVLVGLGENEEPRFGYGSTGKRIARQLFVVQL